MVGFYGVAAREPTQKLEPVLGIGSDGHCSACGGFEGASRENWSATAATFGLGRNLPVHALWEQSGHFSENKNLLNSRRAEAPRAPREI
jgi:hypothetical protein